MESESDRTQRTPIAMLHVFPSFGYGGQQMRFAALAQKLGPEYFHDVVALDRNFEARALISSDAPVRYRAFEAKKSPLISLSTAMAFRRLFADAKPDVLCTYNWGAIEAVISNRLFGSAPNIHFEDGFGPGESLDRQHWRRVMTRRAALQTSTVVVPSRGLEKIAVKRWKLPDRNVRRVENGVDVSRFSIAMPEQPLSGPVVIGAVGALRKEKNFERLVAAVASLGAAHEISLEIVGEGPERGALERAISAAKLNEAACLPGATSAPENAYGRFDIFALSSDTEQAPLSLMEAMAAGLPVVSTDVGDIAEMVSEENRAFVTPLGDDAAFRTALARLVNDAELRQCLGCANAMKAKNDFSVTAMVEAHRTLYQSVIHSTV